LRAVNLRLVRAARDFAAPTGEGQLNQKRKRWLLLLSGWGFILLGIAGLFLPILQGVLFLLIGLMILSTEYVWAHNLLKKLEKRFPKIAAHLHRASEKARSRINRSAT